MNRYLPWLFNPPGNTATQGPREFLDCVAHIRLLSWMLLGAVNHTLKFGYSDGVACMPIPLEASCHIADHVQVGLIYSGTVGERRRCLSTVFIGYYDQHLVTKIGYCDYFPNFQYQFYY